MTDWFACANACWLCGGAWQANTLFDPHSEPTQPWTWAFQPASSRWELDCIFTQQNADVSLKEPTNNTDCSDHKSPFLSRQPHPTCRNLLLALRWNKNHTGLKRLTAELTDWRSLSPAWIWRKKQSQGRRTRAGAFQMTRLHAAKKKSWLQFKIVTSHKCKQRSLLWSLSYPWSHFPTFLGFINSLGSKMLPSRSIIQSPETGFYNVVQMQILSPSREERGSEVKSHRRKKKISKIK